MSPVFRHGRLRLYLLRLLDEEPRHGYEVIRMLRDQFMGVYAPSPGTIYPRLARLEEEGLVTHDEVDGRKVYRITDAGRTAAEVSRQRARWSREEARDRARQAREEAKENVRRIRDDAKDWARAEREQARPGGRGGDWGNWGNWADWPGRRGFPGKPDVRLLHDLEHTVKDFVREMRRLAWQSSAEAGEDALTELRIILDETLDRVRSEIFGPGQPGAPDAPDGEEQEKPAGPPAGTSSTGGPGDTAT